MIRRVLATFIFTFGAIVCMFFLYVVLPTYLVDTYGANKHSFKNQFSSLLVVPPPLPTPSPTPGLTPVTLIIPKLGIQAAVESVGLTSTNNMDVPKNAANVAWYAHGPKPTEQGNAVIAGHFDTPTGRPAIFYHLRTLKINDELELISVNGVHSTFVVTEISTVPVDVFPNEYIFKDKAGQNLNLITCAGVWDAKNKRYTDRIVVYTTLKETKV
jgi:sortase (surface protein transpeptidase)